MKEFFKGKKILDQFPIGTKLFPCPPDKLFALKADGDGLKPEIQSSDILICEFTDKFKNKDFIVIEGKDKVPEVWQAFRDKDKFILQKTNPDHFHNGYLIVENPKVFGVVRMIIKTWSIAH